MRYTACNMLTVPNFLDFTVNAVLRPTFICKLCYKLRSVVTCTFIQIFFIKLCLFYWMALKLPRLLDTASKFAVFSVCAIWKTKKLIKSKPTWKLKHANFILESLEYFCQISSKLMIIILSYTVSKLSHFLRHSVVIQFTCVWGCHWKHAKEACPMCLFTCYCGASPLFVRFSLNTVTPHMPSKLRLSVVADLLVSIDDPEQWFLGHISF